MSPAQPRPLQITLERPGDAEAIHLLTDAAFRDAPHSGGTEARIVDALRTAGALTLSVVALESGELLGHAAFSPVSIKGAAGAWYGLGPVSVRPDAQRRVIGTAVILDGLNRLEAMAAAGCVVLGNPGYYGRFGFESDPDLSYGVVLPGYFQRRVFAGPAAKGQVHYHPAFDIS
jgi:putative acetyltransferase